jgi:hypothetical protein
MNLFNYISKLFKKKNEISLNDLCDIINRESLDQLELARKLKTTDRTIRRKTRSGKIKSFHPKSTTLYDPKCLIIKEEK